MTKWGSGFTKALTGASMANIKEIYDEFLTKPIMLYKHENLKKSIPYVKGFDFLCWKILLDY